LHQPYFLIRLMLYLGSPISYPPFIVHPSPVLLRIDRRGKGNILLHLSAFKFGTSRMRDKVKTNTSEFFASMGVRECYDSLLERNLIDDQQLLCEIVDDLT